MNFRVRYISSLIDYPGISIGLPYTWFGMLQVEEKWGRSCVESSMENKTVVGKRAGAGPAPLQKVRCFLLDPAASNSLGTPETVRSKPCNNPSLD